MNNLAVYMLTVTRTFISQEMHSTAVIDTNCSSHRCLTRTATRQVHTSLEEHYVPKMDAFKLQLYTSLGFEPTAWS
jgi:hypothetical protein